VRPLLGEALSYEALERELLEISNEVVRRALEQRLQESSDAFGDEVLVVRSTAHERYRRHERGSVRYHSVVGPLEVTRWTYRLVET
jgi:hypothetical protein